MRRREFICLIGSSAAATWPLAARAQQPGRPVRLIGVLMNYAETDPVSQSLVAAFALGRDDLDRSQSRRRDIVLRIQQWQ